MGFPIHIGTSIQANKSDIPIKDDKEKNEN